MECKMKINNKTIIKEFFRFFRLEISFFNPLRASLKHLKEISNDKQLKGAEIGVYRGDNAEFILRELNISKLYLIDPYKDYNENWIGDGAFCSISESKKIMLNKMKKFEGQVQIIEKTSQEALNEVSNDLDFVYVDGNHSYLFVKEDLLNYFKKLKMGGMLCGHDFGNFYWVEVTNAVIDFVNEEDLQLYSDEEDWWVIKGLKRGRNKG